MGRREIERERERERKRERERARERFREREIEKKKTVFAWHEGTRLSPGMQSSSLFLLGGGLPFDFPEQTSSVFFSVSGLATGSSGVFL